MEQALKDSVRTVTPGSRSLGPNALASPGLLGSADSGGLHGACTQRQCQNPQGLYPNQNSQQTLVLAGVGMDGAAPSAPTFARFAKGVSAAIMV